MHIPPHVDSIAAALARPLPGFAAKEVVCPVPAGGRLAVPVDESARRAAVLILLAGDDRDLAIPLMRRVHFDADVHSGQISLPGGGVEAGESDEEAALRESQEEVGIDPAQVRLLGRLSAQWIPVSGYVVQPIVGWIPQRVPLEADPDEVDEAFWIDLREIALDRVVQQTRVRRGEELATPGWQLEQGFLWGATAMILAEFLSVIAARD